MWLTLEADVLVKQPLSCTWLMAIGNHIFDRSSLLFICLIQDEIRTALSFSQWVALARSLQVDPCLFSSQLQTSARRSYELGEVRSRPPGHAARSFFFNNSMPSPRKSLNHCATRLC